MSEAPRLASLHSGIRENALTGAIFLSLSSIIIMLTHYIWSQHQTTVERDTRLMAQQVAIRLQSTMQSQFMLIEYQKKLWLKEGAPSQKSFSENILLLQTQFRNLRALNWIDSKGVVRWVVPEASNQLIKDYDLRLHKTVSAIIVKTGVSGTPHASPPMKLVQGGQGVATYFPVYRDDILQGYFNPVFQIEPFLIQTFGRDIWDNYNMKITDGAATVFNSGASGPPAIASGTSEVQVLDRTWKFTLLLKPTPGMNTAKVAILLTGGFGLLVALFMTYLLRLFMLRHEQQLRSERRFRDLFDNAPVAIMEQDFSAVMESLNNLRKSGVTDLSAYLESHPEYIGDVNGKIRVTDMNAATIKLFGAATKQQILSQLPAPIAESALPAFKKLLEGIYTDESFFVVKTGITNFQNQHIIIQLSMPVPNKKHGYVIPVSMLDITDATQAQEAMREAKDRAVLADRAKSMFLANMSHELRTPLNAILGFADLIRHQMLGPVTPPQYLQYAEDIRTSGVLLLKIINSVLDLSKIEAGRYDLNFEEVDIVCVIEDVTKLMREQIKLSEITLKTTFAENLPNITADERAIQQIILNLLSNAIKFTAAGGSIWISADTAPDDMIVISVKDSGIGIAEKDIARVLFPFEQVEGSLSRRYDGTGLGLPLAKRLTELHGGRLELESKLGEGTCIHIYLPRTAGKPSGA